MRPHDLEELRQWAAPRQGIEAYIEPETMLNEMSVVVVDAAGNFLRRPIGGPKGIDAVSQALAVPAYDVEVTGYPQRMRDRIEQERLIKKRQEQARRRAARGETDPESNRG